MNLIKKAKKGFTIVELVIVIGVIGILSAILIPTFVNVTKNAQDAALRSDLASSYSMYIADAADGHKDDHPTWTLEMLAQDKVALTTENSTAANTEYYYYAENEWKIVPLKATEGKLVHLCYTDDATPVATAVQYGSFYVWQLAA